MTSREQIRNTGTDKPVDHLAAQPMLMMHAARFMGVRCAERAMDERKLAEGQLRM